MKASCDTIRAIVDAWEEDGSIDDVGYGELSSHLLDCPACRLRYSSVLPFIARDAGRRGAMPVLSEETSEEFERRVMERVTGAPKAFPRLVVGRRRPRLVRLATLAAAFALFMIGGIVFYEHRTNAGGSEVVVHFVLDAPGAQQVALVGNFTGWDPSKLPLRREAGTNRWVIAVRLEKGKTYLYNFVINGKTWIPDPATDVQISDGFGGESSLIQL